MKQIFLSFIISFSSAKTRSKAFLQLLHALELHSDNLSTEDKDKLMAKALTFKEVYKSAWFWRKKEVLINTLKSELFHA